MPGYTLVAETTDTLIYESDDYSHELWIKKKNVVEGN